MNFPRFSMLFVCLLFASSACDDGGKKSVPQPSLQLSTITVGPVKYQKDPKGLASEVTVHVVDDAGAPLAGVAVHLESDLDHYSTVTPASALTDAAGDAVFSVVGTALDGAELLAHVSTSSTATDVDETLDATALVDFDFSAGVTPLDATYTWEGGTFSLRVSVQDATGPVPEASVTLGTDAPDLLFDGSPILTYVTNASGTFTADATTPNSGLQEVRVQLDGVEGSKSVNVDFYGPRVAGTVSNAQVYPLGFRSARVAAMALNMTDRVTIDLGAPILAQAASESVCPCPVPADFELTLPIIPDPVMLLTDDLRQVKYNYFPIVVYDDLNDDYTWNEGEPLLGARLSAGMLHYAMPTGENPVGQLGWKLVDTIADEPETLDWDFFQDSLDAFIRRSPVHELHLHGADTTAADPGRVAFYLVDATAMPGYTPPMAWMSRPFDALRANPDNLLLLADVPVSEGTYDATLVPPVFTGTQADDWKVTWLTTQGDTVSGYLVIPVVYTDHNGNGQFDADEGPVGTVDAPVGTTEVIFWVIDYPNYELFRDPNTLGVHLGYNRLRVCSVLDIRSTFYEAGTYSFTFSVLFPDQLTGVPFSVVGAGLPLSTAPKATGTFSTHSEGTTLDILLSTCPQCSSVGGEDQFVILSPLNLAHYEYLDWTDLNFKFGSP